jgi:hypothetical protein
MDGILHKPGLRDMLFHLYDPSDRLIGTLATPSADGEWIMAVLRIEVKSSACMRMEMVLEDGRIVDLDKTIALSLKTFGQAGLARDQILDLIGGATEEQALEAALKKI